MENNPKSKKTLVYNIHIEAKVSFIILRKQLRNSMEETNIISIFF